MTRKSTSTVEAKIKKFILHELRDGRRVPSKDIFARAVEQGISENTLAKYAKQWRGTYQVGRRHEWFLLPEPADERPVPKIHDSTWPYPHIHPRILSKDELLRMLDGSNDPLISRLIALLRGEDDEDDEDDSLVDPLTEMIPGGDPDGEDADSRRDYKKGYVEALSDVGDVMAKIEGATQSSKSSLRIFNLLNGWLENARQSLGTK
ncbi:hypothetical protein [Burkholderia ubonensis]|uniref:hypothetical protein n=1 Tax=Burkholderia ubonensis TaxID=101571 RepID=UPI000BA6D60E|nr:hypothetical protein [Burkholderia ubonensis]PAJ83942.1 hypothetical protein CJO70_31810 [Burkholderia ubonensis]PAK04389.1 hypothetical protein CJO67_30690 [Burkholderia ubonensis]RQP33150.1 hypothetical protein DF155_17910 [Burkholderia ubonensis]RQP36691.1 hypothetical protein DF154_20915 [Burkholderia ubonensis]RQP37013.1 hypothetical protein DF156_21950 [Burkholderia ubonensis]